MLLEICPDETQKSDVQVDYEKTPEMFSSEIDTAETDQNNEPLKDAEYSVESMDQSGTIIAIEQNE